MVKLIAPHMKPAKIIEDLHPSFYKLLISTTKRLIDKGSGWQTTTNTLSMWFMSTDLGTESGEEGKWSKWPKPVQFNIAQRGLC
jgi:hypothetical protein